MRPAAAHMGIMGYILAQSSGLIGSLAALLCGHAPSSGYHCVPLAGAALGGDVPGGLAITIMPARLVPCPPPLTSLRPVAGDHLDVDVLGDGGEGDLEAADGGGVAWLELRQPGALGDRLVASWLLASGRRTGSCRLVRTGHVLPVLLAHSQTCHRHT